MLILLLLLLATMTADHSRYNGTVSVLGMSSFDLFDMSNNRILNELRE